MDVAHISPDSATIPQAQTRPCNVAVVMGVSGSGKTTIGEALATRLGWHFIDGDDLHPPENVAKMHAGIPLDDSDRAPWLAAIARQIDDWIAAETSGVITCSALKRHYRDIVIGARPSVRLIYLAGSAETIAKRLAARHGHFMPASLLQSQFATLEPPTADENPVFVRIEKPVEAIVGDIVTALSLQLASIPPPS
jgi:gluconokinase